MKKRWFFLFLGFFFLKSSLVFGAPTPWKLDSAHSVVAFEVKHIFSMVHGHFDDFSAVVRLDPEKITDSECRFTVKTKSINTFNRKRDTHLKSPELFHVSKYPEMRFASTSITKKSGNTYTMEGDLTIKGETRKVRVPLVFHGTTENPFKRSEAVAGFTAEFVVDRLEYGVGTGKYVELGVMGRDVGVTISVELLR